MKTYNILIDLFDHSGHCAEPYIKNNWHIFQVDIKLGVDILTWQYKDEIMDYIADLRHISPDCNFRFGVLAAIPCTDYALCGATHFAKKDNNGDTDFSNTLVDKTKEIIDWIDSKFDLAFWKVENPMSRIHKLNTWLGPVYFKFNPCDFAGYNKISDGVRARLNYLSTIDMAKASKTDIKMVLDLNVYNKQTWLWGKFFKPVIRYEKPVWKECPMHVLYGGKSERTKELRSVDPVGFCQAFYESNN